MIYTVTLNPSLDYVVSVENFRLGCTNRTNSEQLLPGGKGINVSLILKRLGMESVSLGFVAGFTGAEIERRLARMGVRTDFIRLREGDSRINLKLRSAEGTEINGRGPDPGEECVEALLQKLEGLTEGDVLFLSGSVPASVPDDIYARITGRMRERGVITAVDAEGVLLKKTLADHPFLVKPNRRELGDFFDTVIRDRAEAAFYARKMQELGAENVLVSMGNEGAVLLAQGGLVFDAPAPEGEVLNVTGAGDAMIAAFMADWLKHRDYEHAFYRGIAAGSATAFSVHFPEAGEIDALYERIRGGVR